MDRQTRALPRAAWALLLVATTGISAVAAPEQVGIAAERLEAASRFLENVRQRQGISGMSVAVAIDGQLVWERGFGFADAENGVSAGPSSVYRVGSVSKVFTIGALARLYEEGRLDLEADIRTLVPEFPDKGAVVTIRRLAGHLGGLRHYKRGETAAPKRPYTDVVDALELFVGDPLLHEPGELWSYSSYGYTLISAAIQRAAGQPFQDYMRTAVLEPLGMAATRVEVAGAEVENLARLYDHGEPVARNDISYIWAGGGFLSTAPDTARFGSAFLPDSGFVSNETLKVFSINLQTSEGEEVDHGVGWMVDREPDGDKVLYHGGTILGGHSVLYVEPRERIVVAILANEAAGFGLTEAYIVASQLLGRTDPPSFVREAASLKIRRGSRERLLAALDGFQAALRAGNLDDARRLIADDFRSALWPDKDAAVEGLRRWFAAGSVTVGGELDIGVRGIREGATSDISGMAIRIGERTENVTLIFTKQADGAWLLTQIFRAGETPLD